MIKIHLLSFVTLFLALAISVFALQKVSDIRQRADELEETTDTASTNNLILAGYVYIDQNQNGERDISELPLTDASIEVLHTLTKPRNTPTPDPNATDSADVTPEATSEATPLPVLVNSDSFGYFKYSTPSSTVRERNYFRVQLVTPEGMTTTTPALKTYTDLYKRSKKLMEFGVAPQPGTCTPRPDCLDATPACQPPVPEGGWCEPTISPEPTDITCVNPVKKNVFILHKTNGKCRVLKAGNCVPQGFRQVSACPTPTPSPIPTSNPASCANRPICLDNETLITGDPAPGSGNCPVYQCVPITE